MGQMEAGFSHHPRWLGQQLHQPAQYPSQREQKVGTGVGRVCAKRRVKEGKTCVRMVSACI